MSNLPENGPKLTTEMVEMAVDSMNAESGNGFPERVQERLTEQVGQAVDWITSRATRKSPLHMSVSQAENGWIVNVQGYQTTQCWVAKDNQELVAVLTHLADTSTPRDYEV